MKRRALHLCSWMSFFFAVLPYSTTPALAQGQKGAIAGTVTDQSGAVLNGARVSIEPKDITVTTNEQGLFIINDVVAGSYTLTVSYVGFAAFTKTLDVAAGQKVNVDAKLQVQSQSQTVLVTAPRITAEAEAVNVERTADNILQVLPAEVIRSLPNANMADALGRMPSITLERDEGEGKYVQVRGTEPRLTNATIDGINVPSPEPGVRQIKFDVIPADIVEEVQVSKTLQANMDGDGIGGSVNMVTKMATDQPAISASSMGGYTPIINGRGLSENTFTYGQRFGQSKKFGFLLGGSWDWNGRGIDDIEPVPDIATLPNGNTRTWYDGMDIREYQYFRSRWGLGGSTDYRVAEGSDIYLRYFYSDFKNYGDRWAYSLTDNTPGIQLLNPGNVGCGTDSSGATVGPCSGTVSFNNQLRNPDLSIGNLVLGGRHVLTTTWYSWEISAATSRYGNAASGSAKFGSSLSTSNCAFDPAATTNQYLPQWSTSCYTEGYNPANMTLSEIDRSLGHASQLNLGIAGSGAKRYHIGSMGAVIEYGGKFRNQHKYDDEYTQTLNPTGTILLSSFPNALTNNHYYLGGDYKLGYNPKYENVSAYADANPDQFTSSSTQGQDSADFTLVEKVSAGYVMNTIDLSSRFRLIMGLRAEVTSLGARTSAFGNYACGSDTCTSITPAAFSGSYYTLLPSASLRFGVAANTYLRLVYSRGLSRPDPQDIVQAVSWDTTGNGSNRYSVSFGNSNLKAETGDDVDVLVEHYMQPFGMFSAGYFYKYLQNPIVTNTFDLNNYQPPGGPLGNYLATQPINAGHAWVTGFEAAYLQHFSSLPGAWGGFGLSANYGYTASRAFAIPGRSDNPRLQRTSPNAFNISPTYDKGRVSIRVGMSYNQGSIYGYQYADGTPGGVNGPLSDIYFYSHFQVDAQGSVAMSHGLNLIVYGLNLNNAVFGFYQGSPQYMIQREYYQPTVAAGIRWSPKPGEWK